MPQPIGYSASRGDLRPLVGLVHRQVGRPALAIDDPAGAVEHERVVGEEDGGGDAADRLVCPERRDHMAQPARGGEPIGVDERDDLPLGMTQAEVARVRTAPIAGTAHDRQLAASRRALRDLQRVVVRAIVDDDDLVVGVVLSEELIEAAPEHVRRVPADDDHRGERHRHGHGSRRSSVGRTPPGSHRLTDVSLLRSPALGVHR